jgi:hypothetical protein
MPANTPISERDAQILTEIADRLDAATMADCERARLDGYGPAARVLLLEGPL